MIDLDRVRERLKAVGATPNAISEAAGLSRSYVRDMLRGRIQSPSALRLMKLAEALHTTPEYLLGNNESSWPATLQRADDRTIEIKGNAIDKARRYIDAADDGHSETPSNRLMFDLLDAVSDKTMVAMACKFVAQNSYYTVADTFNLSSGEASILMGVLDSDAVEDVSRRLICCRMGEIIDKTLYSEALMMFKVNMIMSQASEEVDLSSDLLEDFVAPLLKAHGLAVRSSETVRLAIMSVFARFLGIRPHKPTDLADSNIEK